MSDPEHAVLRWLHLTDLHVGYSNESQTTALRSLVASISNVADTTPFDLVLLTGDLASPSSTAAMKFFAIKRRPRRSSGSVFLVWSVVVIAASIRCALSRPRGKRGAGSSPQGRPVYSNSVVVRLSSSVAGFSEVTTLSGVEEGGRQRPPAQTPEAQPMRVRSPAAPRTVVSPAAPRTVVSPAAPRTVVSPEAPGVAVALDPATAVLGHQIESDLWKAHTEALNGFRKWLYGRDASDVTLAAYLAIIGDQPDAVRHAFRLVAAVRVRQRMFGVGLGPVVGARSIEECQRVYGGGDIVDSVCWEVTAPVLRDPVLYQSKRGPAENCRDAVLFGLCCFVGLTRVLVRQLRWDRIVESSGQLTLRWPSPDPGVRELSLVVASSVEQHIRDLRDLVRPSPDELLIDANRNLLGSRLRAAADAGGLPFVPRSGHLRFSR